mmetsp:Transcript_7892/g.15293  ORF Transcript_7892/g.15293 Transcript_7892/m.15293 type:complete len:106 (+) Transcript_7892:2030-2347(+)
MRTCNASTFLPDVHATYAKSLAVGPSVVYLTGRSAKSSRKKPPMGNGSQARHQSQGRQMKHARGQCRYELTQSRTNSICRDYDEKRGDKTTCRPLLYLYHANMYC